MSNVFTQKFRMMKIPMLVGIIVLSGCAAIHEEVDRKVSIVEKETKNVVQSKPVRVGRDSLVKKENKTWVARRKPMLEIEEVVKLPDIFRTNFVSHNPGEISVVDLMSRVTGEKGVQIRMSPEVIESVGQSSGSASSTDLPALPGSLPSTTNLGGSGTPAPSYGNVVSNLIYDGPLSGFLDLLSSKMQLSWKYENSQVILYKYETQVFNVKALAGTGTITNGVGGSSQSSGGGQQNAGTTTQARNQTAVTIESNLWKGIEDSVRIMLSPFGKNNFYASPDLGTITISDEPSRLDRVGTYLNELNKDLSKQVALHISIYNVEIEDKDTVGVDWNAVWRSASNGFNFGGLSLGADTLQRAGVSILNGPWTDSSFVIGALNKVGKTSLITSGKILTMNRQAAPLQIIDETNYLAQITTTISGDGLAQTSLEPGTVTSGFTTTVTPKIEDDGDVLLQFAGSLSNLKEITRFDVGGAGNSQSIQLPQKSVRDFLQRVKLRSGETLVLTGFEQESNNSKDEGVGNSKNLLLGGKQFASGKRLSVVIFVTPYIIN